MTPARPSGAGPPDPQQDHRRGRTAIPPRWVRPDDDRRHRRRRRGLCGHRVQDLRRQARPRQGHPHAGARRRRTGACRADDPTTLQARELDGRRIIEAWGALTLGGRAPRSLRSSCSSERLQRGDPEVAALLDEMDADRLRRMTDNARRLGRRRSPPCRDHRRAGGRRALDLQRTRAVRAPRPSPRLDSRPVQSVHRRRDDRRAALNTPRTLLCCRRNRVVAPNAAALSTRVMAQKLKLSKPINERPLEDWAPIAVEFLGAESVVVKGERWNHHVIHKGDGPPLLMYHGIGGHAGDLRARSRRSRPRATTCTRSTRSTTGSARSPT